MAEFAKMASLMAGLALGDSDLTLTDDRAKAAQMRFIRTLVPSGPTWQR
jgi:hypothetical protein